MELHYLGSVQYFSKFTSGKSVCIEQHEHYSKGSFRNRCYIAGANGPLRLSIPLEKGKNDGMLITEVRIDNKNPWQDIHWRSIMSAYGKAPYFEYYGPELAQFFEKRYEFLFRFNLELHQTLLELIGIDNSMTFSESYEKFLPASVQDLRSFLSPKIQKQKKDTAFKEIKYNQLFEDRHGFTPGLSVIDLLFCKGPEAIGVIEASCIG
ncbi:MAG: WbqC family protein [Bacteroidota bacterium]